jgi:HD-like signal output (HDOD) protein
MSFAMKQIREGQKLQAAQTYLKVVWNEGVTVAALCYVLAKRFTKINPDEALLVGLLHGIGKLYILAKAEVHPELFHSEEALEDLLQEWHPGIGSAILESLGFSDAIASAVGNYQDVTRKHEGDADFTDLLMISHLVSGLLNEEGDFELQLDAIPASRYFTTSVADFFEVLQESAEHLSSLKQALGN